MFLEYWICSEQFEICNDDSEVFWYFEAVKTSAATAQFF